jgi:hypothetical protein
MNEQADIPKKILKLVDAIHVLDQQTERRKVEQDAHSTAIESLAARAADQGDMQSLAKHGEWLQERA